jgi:hypothetical protein
VVVVDVDSEDESARRHWHSNPHPLAKQQTEFPKADVDVSAAESVIVSIVWNVNASADVGTGTEVDSPYHQLVLGHATLVPKTPHLDHSFHEHHRAPTPRLLPNPSILSRR